MEAAKRVPRLPYRLVLRIAENVAANMTGATTVSAAESHDSPVHVREQSPHVRGWLHLRTVSRARTADGCFQCG